MKPLFEQLSKENQDIINECMLVNVIKDSLLKTYYKTEVGVGTACNLWYEIYPEELFLPSKFYDLFKQ